MKPWMHAVIYQTTWFVTVLLGNVGSLIWAIPLVASVVFRQRAHVIGFVALVATLGYSVDVVLHLAGLIQFNGHTLVGPVWLLVLWVGFANVIWHLLYRIPYIWLRALLGAVSGPLSYYSGAILGAAQPMELAGIIAFAIWWAIAFPAAVHLRHWWARRFEPGSIAY